MMTWGSMMEPQVARHGPLGKGGVGKRQTPGRNLPPR